MIRKQILFLLVILVTHIQLESHTFAESFIASYDLANRDTHEYNPYTLTKAKTSFLQLEKRLNLAGYKLDSRYLIFGYQEDAVPPYTTDWERKTIKDEAVVESAAGISRPSRNIFGFITGFILKDAQWMETHWNKSAVTHIMHVCAKPISLFSDEAFVFQKHAFGIDYEHIMMVRDRIEQAVYIKNIPVMLNELISFWTQMQQRSSKTGSQEEVATQDMDFSISYAQAIVEGVTPIKSVFVGPDITYPIEVLSMQGEQSTLHAQAFIDIFEKKLTPINDEATAYIFCSFIDGVGKSTLFNNMKNYKKFGCHFGLYTRGDNSSSQVASLFEFKHNVYLVDLPGQMSHFTCKPDGYVFVDIQTAVDKSSAELATLRSYITTHAASLIATFQSTVDQVANEDLGAYKEIDYMRIYAYNCALLNQNSTEWIAFNFQNDTYIFNRADLKQIRILVPVEKAHSLGLKNVQPEQMLFTKGLSLPMSYEIFLEDLLAKLQSKGIKNIRFVDFLSMYPRSSRETIRLNFVLQHLKKIFGERYDLSKSFYSHKVHPAQETCGMLVEHYGQFVLNLVSETIVRLAIDRIMQKNENAHVTQLAGKKLEKLLQEEVTIICSEELEKITQLVRNRLAPEREKYLQLYQFDRVYQAIVLLQPHLVRLLVETIAQLSTYYFNNEHMKNLWFDFDGDWSIDSDRLSTGIPIRNFCKINSLCKDQLVVAPFLKTVRSMCYAQVSNFLHAIPGQDGQYDLPIVSCGVVPFKLVCDKGILYLLQRKLPLLSTAIADVGFIWNGISAFDKNKHVPQLVKFNVFSKSGNGAWGLYDDMPYYLDWNISNTTFGVYAYSYTNTAKNVVTRVVDSYIKNMIEEGKSNPCIVTSQLLAVLQDPKIAQALAKEIEQKKAQDMLPDDPRLDGIRLFVRIIATIELLCKDPNGKIMIRNGSKEDFIAAIKLLESITLPYFFAIKLKQPLFDDYEIVSPIVPIELH